MLYIINDYLNKFQFYLKKNENLYYHMNPYCNILYIMSKYNFKLYIVDGYVRDMLLNTKSKDVDYVAVPLYECDDKKKVYDELCLYLEENKYKIFYKKEDCYTIRAEKNKVFYDIVLPRNESYNSESRIPECKIGTLKEDLLRRDFTINALAMDVETKEIIDYCNGQSDLKNKLLRTPFNSNESLFDDPLRILRCLRLSITKGFTISNELLESIKNQKLYEKFKKTISRERISDELCKMLSYDTLKSLEIFNTLKKLNNDLYNYIFTMIPLTTNMKIK